MCVYQELTIFSSSPLPELLPPSPHHRGAHRHHHHVRTRPVNSPVAPTRYEPSSTIVEIELKLRRSTQTHFSDDSSYWPFQSSMGDTIGAILTSAKR
ncbi:hypothetical protein V6N13_001749 [Hibiscus sabdariffa]